MSMKLQYIDDEDKCYGVTGMAIGITVCDADGLITAISLDAPEEDTVEFSPEYYFNGNPRLSAKVSWNHILNHFNVSMNMLISNVLCRSYVHRSEQLSDDIRTSLLKLLDEEGRESCMLESDEIERMFNKNLNYMHRVFSHTGVKNLAREFAEELRVSRRMTRGEILEKLAALQVL